MAIYLIRHGETLGNAARIVQRPDNPLSPRGIAQAERLARQLETAGISRIVSSDLRRATMTAEFLQRATGGSLRFDPLLQERNFGDLRGTAYAELTVDIFAPDFVPPNGESWAVFHERVDRAWKLVREVAEAGGGHLAVVTHGLVCRSLAARHLTLPAGADVPVRWENASLTIAEDRVPWRVHVLNSITHLADLAGSPAGVGGAV
jgi:broad specificity phosphatase PhoE